jgi:small-conductance mechanosensitive channel
MDQLNTVAREYGQKILEFMSRPDVLMQLGLIIVAFVLAHFLSRRISPTLEGRARNIKGMPGLLRFVVAFLHRFKWLLFAALLAIVHAVTRAGSWLGADYLIYSAMLLSAAWLLISVVSQAIRSRAIRRLFAMAAWAFVAMHILSITDDISRILDSAGFTVGGTRLSILTLVQVTLFLTVLSWSALSLGNFVDRRLQRVGELTPSLRVLLGKILRISLLLFAALVAMQVLGIDLTALTVLSGAVGVGIGFGLQKVVSNFISGIIILMDQSIKPGDTITLGETFGWIRELRARFVSVVTRDGREYLIPNEDFITTQVINWSFSDKFVRLDVPFGVSYDSDPHDVTRLAIAAAASVDRVDSTYREPVCWMTAFGDSSLDFLLRFWIEDPQKGLTNIRGKVLLALWDAFKENGIGIPYPHRELIMKSPVRVVPPQAEPEA